MKSSIQPETRKRDENLNRPPADRLLTPADVAAMSGLSMNTLSQWRSQRRGIPFVKISRNCVRYRQSDFDNWILGRTVRVDVDAP
jgi:predicted DNA-binding transcriptional regulator AlpA